MSTISSFTFVHKGQQYRALVRITYTPYRHYHITIMNGELETLLFGNHVFIEKDGEVINSAVMELSAEVQELRQSIAGALLNNFKSVTSGRL